MDRLESIEARVLGYFLERGVDLAPEEDIFTSGMVDSIAMMQTIAFVEKEFRCKIPPQDLVPENFRTIRTMAGYLEELAGS
jgi:acyl carrier protein